MTHIIKDYQFEKNGYPNEIIYMRKPDGSPKQIFGVIHDISQIRRAEMSLRESEERYHQLFDTMMNGFALHEIICDSSGKPMDYRFIEINKSFERLTGLAAANLIGRTVLEVMPGTESCWIENYGQVALTGKPIQFENYSGALDRYYSVTAYSPKHKQFAVIFEDITERRKTEEELRRRKEELDIVLDVMPVMVWIGMDPECRVITGNRAVNELVGIPVGSNVSQTAAEAGQATYIRHLKPDGTEYRAEELPMQRAIATGQSIFNEEIDYSFSDGRHVFAIGNTVPLFDEKNRVRGAVAAFMDITERRQVEEEIVEINEILKLTQEVSKSGSWDWNIVDNTFGSRSFQTDNLLLYESINILMRFSCIASFLLKESVFRSVAGHL